MVLTYEGVDELRAVIAYKNAVITNMKQDRMKTLTKTREAYIVALRAIEAEMDALGHAPKKRITK